MQDSPINVPIGTYYYDVDPSIKMRLLWLPSNDPDGDDIIYKVSVYENGGLEGPDDDRMIFDDYITQTPSQNPQTYFDVESNNLDYDKTYYWAVWAEDEYGLSSPSPEPWFTFTTKASTPSNDSPYQPILDSPEEGETVDGTFGVPFSWIGDDPNGDTLKYHLIIKEFSEKGPPINYTLPGYFNPNTNIRVDYALAAGSTYFWSVWSEDPQQSTSTWANWQSFTTKALPRYSASYSHQSPSGYISMIPGQVANFEVSYINTGNQSWNNTGTDPDYVELLSCDNNGNIVPSYLYPGNGIWVSNNTTSVTSSTESTVSPDGTATFSFSGKVPDSEVPRFVNVYFRMSHIQSGYLSEIMHFTIKVGEPLPEYTSSFYRKSPDVTVNLEPGQSYNYVVSYTNTGNREWKNDPASPDYIEFHSCDVNGAAVPSYLYPGDNIWISNDKIKVVSSKFANVAPGDPGENAWFEFSGKVPDDSVPGPVNVYFRPWHKTAGYAIGEKMYFTINVIPTGSGSSPPTVDLIQPIGGEILTAGGTYEIKWNASDDIGVSYVDIYLSISGDDNYGVILYREPNTGSKMWNLPNQSMLCKLKVIAYDDDGNTGYDISDAPFQISTYCPTISAPNFYGAGSENVGADYQIYWSPVINATNYTIEEDTVPSFDSPSKKQYQTSDFFFPFNQ